MKIVDSQGKLFGWINIIDFFAIIISLIIIRAFFLGHQLYLANKNALVMVRQEEELKAMSEAQLKQMAESRGSTTKDRLANIEIFQEEADVAMKSMDARLETLERSAWREGAQKNFRP